jgi:hypothetical protein
LYHCGNHLKGAKSLGHALGPEQLDKVDNILRTDLMELGVHSVVLLDMAGNIIVDLNNGKITFDVYSLAALAAGNFGAVSTMAQMIGEEEIFLLFHKGKKKIYISARYWTIFFWSPYSDMIYLWALSV